MKELSLSEGYQQYDYADRAKWPEAELKILRGRLLKFINEHNLKQTAPQEVLSSVDKALINISFELTMRRREIQP